MTDRFALDAPVETAVPSEMMKAATTTKRRPVTDEVGSRFNLIGPRALLWKFKVLAYSRGSNQTAELLRMIGEEVAEAERKGELTKHIKTRGD